MGLARRQKREFERAWKKQSKKNSLAVKTEKDPALQELVNTLIKEYEADTSSK